jgi:hypothetical protein
MAFSGTVTDLPGARPPHLTASRALPEGETMRTRLPDWTVSELAIRVRTDPMPAPANGRWERAPQHHPRSKAALLADARQVAREARGRGAFVRRARVLPIGLPLGAGLAALRYQQRRAHGDSVGDAAVAAALALLATMTLTTGAAQLEWELRRLAYRRRHDQPR